MSLAALDTRMRFTRATNNSEESSFSDGKVDLSTNPNRLRTLLDNGRDVKTEHESAPSVSSNTGRSSSCLYVAEANGSGCRSGRENRIARSD